MINILIPIVEQNSAFSEFIDKIAGRGVKIFVGISEDVKLDFHKNVEVHVFAKGSNVEEILNALHSCQMKKGRILIIRRPLTDDEYQKLTTSQKDIATLRPHHNKLVSFFKKTLMSVVKRFFAFSYFEDISAICFGESMFELLSVCNNISMASRVNRYIGVEAEEIETTQKQVRKEYSRWKNILLFLLWTTIFVGSVVGGVLVCVFTPLHVLIVVTVVFWIALALFLWFVGIINFLRTLAVGNLRYGRAEEIG